MTVLFKANTAMSINKYSSMGGALLLAVLLFIASLISITVRAASPLKDGDRVVIYGDSITEQKYYSLYMQQYVDCRYPNMKIRFYNAGWSGDRAPGALNRLERDVLSLNPTVVTLFFGMNDGSYTTLNDNILKTYKDNMEKIIQALQAKNVRVVVFTPGCVDYDRKKEFAACDYNKNLEALGNACKELAEKYKCDFVDVHHPMVAFQAEQKAKQADFTMIPDSVHPDTKGHLIMARQMLTAFAEPMPPIGTVDLKGSPAEGIQITSKVDNSVSFKVKLRNFPFWIDPASMNVARDCGMLDFATPKLAVKGLPAGNYDVNVDGKIAVRGVQSEALAAGVGVPIITPNAKILHDLIAAKESNYFNAWRNIRLNIQDKEYQEKIVKALMDADEAYHNAIWAAVSKAPEVSISIIPKPEGGNLAQGCKYECSDPNKYNWGIGGLTDGSWEATGTTCFATGDGANFPKTVTIDLEKPAMLNTITIGVPGFGSTKTVKAAVSADNKTFTEVGSYEFSLRKEERKIFSFNPVNARYVRLTYVDNYPEDVNYSKNFAFTTEVEVFAKK